MKLSDIANMNIENKKIYRATWEYSQRVNYGKVSVSHETYEDIICFTMDNIYCIVVANEFSHNPIVHQFGSSDKANNYFKAIVKTGASRGRVYIQRK